MWSMRPGRPDEADSIVGLWREADAEPTTTDYPEKVRQLMAADADAVIVAEDGGRLVGTVIAGWDHWRGNIYRLAVVPDQRGRGLGRHLLEEAVRRLGAAGAVRVSAIVVDDDEQATAFWTAVGWHRQSSRARFVKKL
jgi:ribosomal protein S18 acetylase RimI-like enzyme